MKNGITVAYSGVHQAYQLALAAEELGKLERFHCSLFAGEGKWGGLLARLLGPDALLNRRADGIDSKKASEYPWPLLAHHFRSRLLSHCANDWVQANSRFDRWVARHLKQSESTVFVGVETCTAESFAVAQERGMMRILDCPQVHPKFLENVLTKAAAGLGLQKIDPVDSEEMLRRKQTEFDLADYLLTISPVHTRSFTETGVPRERVVEIPLWADPLVWYPSKTMRCRTIQPLRVLFVGSITLRKGIPYLLKACQCLDDSIHLTLVGSPSGGMDDILELFRGCYEIIPPMTKSQLRSYYWNADLLVLPSLVDSFGFVAMEAMACGLPVIVTENCGVPVPDSSWRVPIMDSDAIARRLNLYAEDRDLCREHGLSAAEFARQFTPERYRDQIKALYRQLLSLPSMANCAKDSFRAAEHIDPIGTKKALP